MAMPALFVSESVGGLPTATPTRDTKFIYLCVFPTALKVGVSGSLYSRIAVLQSKRRERFERIYFTEMKSPEALRRESIIKREWGPMPTRANGHWTGYFSEWLDRSALPGALGVVLVTEAADALAVRSARFPMMLMKAA